MASPSFPGRMGASLAGEWRHAGPAQRFAYATTLDTSLFLTGVGEHLPQVRRSVYEQRLLYEPGIGLVVGLAAHVGGYLLKSSATTEPFGLVADLLYALGWAP